MCITVLIDMRRVQEGWIGRVECAPVVIDQDVEVVARQKLQQECKSQMGHSRACKACSRTPNALWRLSVRG